ncbi:hypothetical protein [Microterricola pindariensis]|uniref:hypothetical protein n=1 Tax=Microterricola pindariensis TaxID=478010 RepID=UPI00105728FC|nr:hypothetical protein [Microterricola pindariensis]
MASVASGLLGLALLAATLTGCTAAAAPAPETTALSQPERVADIDGAPQDAAIAATCAAVATTDTLLHNARTDLDLGTITGEQHTALLDSVIVTYRSLQVVPASQRGLRAEIDAVASYLASATPTDSLAPFDPDSGEFRALFEPIRLACEENGSELYVFATTGG